MGLVMKKSLHGFNKFYVPVFQRDRIQTDMEDRAVQLILKSIIGDDSFHGRQNLRFRTSL